MSKEILKSLIDLIDEKDFETIFKVLVRFVPEDYPLPDEIEAIKVAEGSILKYGTVSHSEIGWN